MNIASKVTIIGIFLAVSTVAYVLSGDPSKFFEMYVAMAITHILMGQGVRK